MHHGERKQELTKRALLDADTVVLRSSLVHRDSGSNATASERFLAAVKRSQARVTQLQKNLQSRIQAQAVTNLESPVSPGGGEYLMQFAVGTPPQQFTAIVDTGSDLCWVQCSPCTRCFQQPDALFDPTASSTYSQASCTDALCQVLGSQSSCSRRSTCNYFYAYGDQSTTQGDLAFETVTLPSASVPNIAIGCGRNNQGTFTLADGLVGLGQGPLSFPSQLSPSVAKIFSYCLVQQLTSNSGTSPITFGSSAANANVKYTPLVSNPTNPTFWYVQVTGVSIGGRAVTIPSSVFRINSNGGGGVILDSGTTITSWDPAAFNPILAAFRRQITYPEVSARQYQLSLCYDVSGVAQDSLTFPNMVVGLANNVQFAIPAENLWVVANNAGTTICLAMGSSTGLTIIGNYQQQNVLIVYDGVNRRVGIQTTQCNTL